MKISARYEVLGLLGQGGMGVVYHVRDTTRGRENALKTLAPGRSEDIVERFLTEAQVMFRLEHDNIVRVFDFGKDGETYFLTMELIRGKNLRQLLNARQNKGFPLTEVIRMGIETADALNYAHSQKPEAVVHRDIKPVNIMIEEETGRVVVTDFGIAKLMAETGSETQAASDLSRTVFAGTVPYSAPEQFQAAGTGRRLDARVDIYALGIVLFEIYTGRHFFAGLSADEVELHHRSIESGQCPVKSTHACDHRVQIPDTPASFSRVIERAIARDRNERYRTAAEMLADLQACSAAESVQAVASARASAEAAGAFDAAPTDFRRGGELEQEAKAAQERGEHAKAGELYRNALQAFGSAQAQAGERLAQRAVQEAKAAMQVVAQEATDRDTGALAPDAMRQAAQLVATAEASEAQGQFEQAATQYREAEAAFRTALAGAEQAAARKEIEGELPALRAARESAEQADAPTYAADAFGAAVRDQVHIEEALAAGEFARARELLPKARDGFAVAEAEAKHRLAQSVDEARAAMRTVAAEASAAGAPTSARAEFIEAETLAKGAEKLVERGELDLAIAQLGRATDAYRAAVTAATRAGEQALLQKELPAIRSARAEAENAEAPALAADLFRTAAEQQSELEAALAAGELTRVRTLLPKVSEGYAAAKSAAVMAQASSAVVEARTAMERTREAALAAGAERLVPDALAKARARERDGAGAEQRQQWERAESLYRDAAKAYDDVRTAALRRAEEQRLASALAEARSAMEAARTRAKDAGAAQHAAELYREAGAIAKEAGAASNDAAGMTRAAADYARATERYDAATAGAERIARRNELKETLAAVEEAKKDALDAGAARNAEFQAAADELAAAERALAADELSLVMSSAAAARDRFQAAKTAVEQAKAEAAADTALADVAARCAEAREAGAELAATEAWNRAVDEQKRALARRHDGEYAAVLPLATAAEQSFAAALDQTARAARESAVTARNQAQRAGADGKTTEAADKSFTVAEQRLEQEKLVAATAAFRTAAKAYANVVEVSTSAAKKASSDAQAAEREAIAADAPKLAAEEHTAALALRDEGARKLASGASAEAEKNFADAARGFRTAVKTAAHRRLQGDASAAQKKAAAARDGARQVNASELAATELRRADEAFAQGEKALERGDYEAATTEFKGAADAFEKARIGAARAKLEREARQARTRAERLRDERSPAATGFLTRRRLGKANAALEKAVSLVAAKDFEPALAAFNDAAQLYDALPKPSAPAPVAPAPAKTAKPAKRRKDADPEGTEVDTFKGPPLDTPTVITPEDRPTVVARPAPAQVPAARSIPVAWISLAAGVLLIVGVWVVRDRFTGSSTHESLQPPAPGPVANVAKPPQPEPPAATVAAQPAKPPPPVAPAPAKPEIARTDPEDARVEAAHEKQQFMVALADPTGATYEWSIDGKVLDDANQPTVTIPPTDKSQHVQVVARTSGGEARREWDLAALAPLPPPAPPQVAKAPTIVPDPRDKTLQVQPGKNRRLAVRATSEDRQPLRYAWFVDGKTVAAATGSSFDFTADDEGATRQVRAEVSSGGGPVSRYEWTVTVPLLPVTVARRPAATELVADLGDSTDLSVDARAGQSGASDLSYQWTVDRRPVNATGPRFTYHTERPGVSDIEVRVEAPERQAAVAHWTVRVRDIATPAPAATQPPQIANINKPQPTPIRGGDPQREVENWIASYRDAYQEKNVDRLVSLGVLKPENRGKVSDALNDLKDLKVSIASKSIDLQGADTAVVTLTREDSFNAGGRTQTQAINIKKTLRKVNGTWVAQP